MYLIFIDMQLCTYPGTSQLSAYPHGTAQHQILRFGYQLAWQKANAIYLTG
jgi:hypothetical protein